MICSSCRNETDPASLFCHVCDAYRPDPECGKKANVATRLFAHFLDVLVAFAIFLTIALVSCGIGAAGVGLGTSANSQDVAGAGVAMGFGMFFLAFIGYVAFLCVFLSRGKTPGKALAGIRVVDKRNGSFPGFGRMLLRETLGKFVSGLFLGLGYFFAIFDRDSQAWHDKIAGTVVLKGGRPALQTGVALQASPSAPMHGLPVGSTPSLTSMPPTSPVASAISVVDPPTTAGADEADARNLQAPSDGFALRASPGLTSVQEVVCRKCGSSADGDARFCTACGTPL